jgi:hypothetical protein
LPFIVSVNKRKVSVSVIRLQQKKLKLPFFVSGIPETLKHGDEDIGTWTRRQGTEILENSEVLRKEKTEYQAIFP